MEEKKVGRLGSRSLVMHCNQRTYWMYSEIATDKDRMLLPNYRNPY